MVSKGYAGYCIPDAKCEMSFVILQDQKCKQWSFIPIYDVFKYK